MLIVVPHLSSRAGCWVNETARERGLIRGLRGE